MNRSVSTWRRPLPPAVGATTRAAVMILLLATVLAGCGLFKRTSEFDRVAEERPLEIPPDLDRPDVSPVMDVPGVEPPPAQRGAGGAVPGVLEIDDTVDSTYRRVAIALERVGIPIAARRDEVHELLVEYEDEEAREERPGFFARTVLRRKGPTDHSGRYRLLVRPSGRGSAVSIETEDGGSAPRRVSDDILGALEVRLG